MTNRGSVQEECELFKHEVVYISMTNRGSV